MSIDKRVLKVAMRQNRSGHLQGVDVKGTADSMGSTMPCRYAGR